MYSIAGHGSMMADRARMEAYVAALREVVTPASVVVDIGTGLGPLAIAACRLGARKVFAVEPAEIIGLAAEVAAASGCADRIQFIQALSTSVSLPEPADVIVSDLRGVLPLFQLHLPAIADARRRLLAPGGRLIPRRDTLWVAVAEAPDLYRRHVAPWGDQPSDIDMRPAGRLLANTWRRCDVKADQLLTEPVCWGSLDYERTDHPDASGTARWQAGRAGTAHGLVLWFDAELAPGLHFSNAPGRSASIYGQAFFPLSKPLSLIEGDEICCSLTARLVGDDYVWRWRTQVRDRQALQRPGLSLDQSTLLGLPLSAPWLQRGSADHVPRLDDEGRVDLFVLQAMDGALPLGRIADALATRFPERFGDPRRALDRVSQLSRRYSRG